MILQSIFKAKNVVFNAQLVLHRRGRFGKHSCNVLDYLKGTITCYNKLVCPVSGIG